MNPEGYVPLHRKTLNNRIFKYDPNAWRVFEVLLMLVDWQTAQWSGGIYQLAGWAEMNPNTVYAALERLKKAGMIAKVANNKYSTFTVCSWEKYQIQTMMTRTKQEQDKNKIRTKQDSINKLIIKEVNKTNVQSLTEQKKWSVEDERLTKRLNELVLENYPFLKQGNLEKAYYEMGLLNRVDGRDYKVIEFIINWCQQDEFWKQNIRSVSKLRKQFDSLMIKAKSDYDKQKGRVVTI